MFESLVNNRLRELKLTDNQIINQMFAYLIAAGGKRLRPCVFLTLINDLAPSFLQKYMDETVNISCAIELVHQSSLVHDDLPSLDNDDIRRGQPTIHRQFNEGYAILFGDFLVNSAFLLVLRSGFDCKKTSKILDALLESNSKLLEGQFLDITAGSDPETVAILKTANLFSGIFKSAGILVDLETEIVEILQELGLSFGALFQFEDDFRDKEKDNTAKSINNSTLLLSEFDQAVKKYKSRFAIALRNLQNLSGSNLRQFQEFVSKLDFTGIGGLGYLNNENLFRPE